MTIWAFPRTDSNDTAVDPPWVIARGGTESDAEAAARPVSGQLAVIGKGHQVPSKAAKKWEPLLGKENALLVPEDDRTGYPLVEDAL